MSAPYPPQPWELRGQLHASVFVVTLADVPVDLPPGCRPVRIGRFAIVATAWVSYEPGGVLDYKELMATLLVRRGWRFMPTVIRIWVDSEASRRGGRELWGIPKELARFEFTPAGFTCGDEVGPIATGTAGPGLRLPGRWPLRFRLVQWLHGTAKVTPVRVRANVAIARAGFTADPGGPLAFLAGRRPVMSLRLGDFRLRFGAV